MFACMCARPYTDTFAVSGGAAGAKYRNNIDFDACNGTSDALKKVYAPKSGLKEFFAKYGAAFKKAE